MEYDEVFIFEYTPVMKELTLYAYWIERDTSNDNNISTDKIKKNEGDVRALTKIIEEQRARGAMVSQNIDSFNQYVWKVVNEEYRLTEILWEDKKLKGDISFSGLPQLTFMRLGEGGLTNLDVSGNSLLLDLRCSDNELAKLDLSNNKELQFLGCEHNNIQELNINENTKLETLICHTNQLEYLDISKNQALICLECGNNKITDLK